MSDSLPVVQKAQPDLLEELASLEHDQWWDWSTALSHLQKIQPARLTRWKKNWIPYSELPEMEKNKDRVYARKVLAIIERERLGYEKKIEGYEKREQTLKKQIVKLAYRVSGLPMFHSPDIIEQNKIVKELLGLSKQ